MSIYLRKPEINLGPPKSLFKELGIWLLLLLALGLAIFPISSALNDVLTQVVLSLKAYRIVSEYIVPIEVRWVVVILRFFGVDAYPSYEYILVRSGEKERLIELIWNCVGWQSILMFIITAFVGLHKKFTLESKIKVLIFGFLGTILTNILRITIIILVLSYLSHELAIVFHDYGALLTNTAWLFFFWWFSYSYVLEEKRSTLPA